MNLRDYIAWRGDLTLDMVPFNQVDAAIFSQLPMVQLDEFLIKNNRNLKMTIRELAECLKEKEGKIKYSTPLHILDNNIIKMITEMGNSLRYQNLVVGNYINQISKDEETQFSALTIDLDHHTRVVSFSGTDDTLVGWKENFNMLCLDNTSGQHLSCEYLKKVSKNIRHLYVVGHSKGANLTLYSTLHSPFRVQRKIIEAIGFDGPGLTEDVELIVNFDKNIEKVTFYVPDSSIIGVLFDHYETVKVVKSNAKGLFQHDLFSWEVLGNDFVYEEKRTQESIHIENKIKEMISKMDEHTKHTFVDEGYRILTNTNSETLTDMTKDKIKIAKNFLGKDSHTKGMFTKIFLELASDKVIREVIINNIITYIKNKNNKDKNAK